MPLKKAIEKVVNATKDDGKEAAFNMKKLYESAWQLLEGDSSIAQIIPSLKVLGKKHYVKLAYALLRNVFLIELVKKPKIETTKFRVRWFDGLDDDPRGCSFKECMQIARELLVQLPEWLKVKKEHADTLLLSFDNSMLPYEAPIDYKARRTANGKLHELGNLVWYYDELALRTLKLRQFLTDAASSPDAEFFKRVLTDKIRVKTYLTDRVLTGDHKTNREKRWETHPESVHFAERRVCMAIEYCLITQVCRFDGFPKDVVSKLQEQNILPVELPIALCPITGDPLSYEAFHQALLHPEWGKSDFQVGHLNPLKLGDTSQAASGHCADNICWITADGNRIQGSLSLEDVRLLIARIAENYTTHGWWPKKPK